MRYKLVFEIKPDYGWWCIKCQKCHARLYNVLSCNCLVSHKNVLFPENLVKKRDFLNELWKSGL